MKSSKQLELFENYQSYYITQFNLKYLKTRLQAKFTLKKLRSIDSVAINIYNNRQTPAFTNL